MGGAGREGRGTRPDLERKDLKGFICTFSSVIVILEAVQGNEAFKSCSPNARLVLVSGLYYFMVFTLESRM